MQVLTSMGCLISYFLAVPTSHIFTVNWLFNTLGGAGFIHCSNVYLWKYTLPHMYNTQDFYSAHFASKHLIVLPAKFSDVQIADIIIVGILKV